MNDKDNTPISHKSGGDNILADLYDYISKHGLKLNKKSQTVLDSRLIRMGNNQVIIKLSRFKKDPLLLKNLLKYPDEGIDDVLRIVIEGIIENKLTDNTHPDLMNWEIVILR